MKKKVSNGKIPVDEALRLKRELLSPQELKLIKQLTKRDKNERFRRVLV